MKLKASTLHRLGNRLVDYMYKNPEANMLKLVKLAKLVAKTFFRQAHLQLRLILSQTKARFGTIIFSTGLRILTVSNSKALRSPLR